MELTLVISLRFVFLLFFADFYGKSGLLVEEGDVAGLTRAIARVLDSETLRRNFAIEGMKRAKIFSIEEIATRWLRA